MKTQIIALANREDYLSVRDKLNWSQTGRVLLTWPNDQAILSHLDLILIQRHSFARGVQLAFVSPNAEIRSIAKQMGIAVFDTTKEAQSTRWRSVRRKKPTRPKKSSPSDLETLRTAAHPRRAEWTDKPLVRWGAFLICLLALAALLVYIIPAASLSLQPESQPQSLTLEVTASTEIIQVNLTGRLPAYPLSVIVEARDSLPATGTVMAPDKPATGGIQFTNLTEEPVTVPIGSVVSTLDQPAIRFATTRAGQVPAGVGRRIIVSAEALTRGTAGNLPANSLVAVEGKLGLSLSATNLSATHSGTDSLVRSPSEADRQALLQQVTDALRQTALAELHSNLPPGDLALTQSMGYLRTLEETYSPEPGQPGEHLNLILRLEFDGQAVSFEDLRTLVTPALDAALPQGFKSLPDSLSVTLSSTPVQKRQGEYSFSLTAKRSLQADIPNAEVIALIQGKPSHLASQNLQDLLPLTRPAQIEISPSWWQRLPFNPFRIQVETISVQ